MDYTNIVIAVASVATTILSICKIVGKKFDKIDGKFDKIDGKFDKIDGKFDKIEHELKEIRKEANANKEELRKEANANKEELRKEANANKEELQKGIHGLDRKINRLEDRLEFSNKIVYVQHEDLKEN